MGEIRKQRPVLLVAAVSSRHVAAIEDWTRQKSALNWGNICLESALFHFNETRFYTRSMGENLRKKIFAFEKLIPAEKLPEIKILSNKWEQEFAGDNEFPESRPLNIDPGYVTEAKLVLATTKDRDHRVYLNDGIFAEVTLHYTQHRWRSSRWTYPDYQRDDVLEFLTDCRNYLRQRYESSAGI